MFDILVSLTPISPFLVHDDSGPPFRVGEFKVICLIHGASRLALTCVNDKSIGSEGVSPRRAAQSKHSLSRLFAKLKSLALPVQRLKHAPPRVQEPQGHVSPQPVWTPFEGLKPVCVVKRCQIYDFSFCLEIGYSVVSEEKSVL